MQHSVVVRVKDNFSIECCIEAGVVTRLRVATRHVLVVMIAVWQRLMSTNAAPHAARNVAVAVVVVDCWEARAAAVEIVAAELAVAVATIANLPIAAEGYSRVDANVVAVVAQSDNPVARHLFPRVHQHLVIAPRRPHHVVALRPAVVDVERAVAVCQKSSPVKVAATPIVDVASQPRAAANRVPNVNREAVAVVVASRKTPAAAAHPPAEIAVNQIVFP